MKKIIAAVAVLFITLPLLRAQGVASSVEYFQPGYAHRHAYNPALLPQWGYVSFPGAGMLSVNIASNLGLADLFYPVEGGKLGTFLHPDVSLDQAMKRFHKNNRFAFSMHEDILSAGWYWGRSFWNVSLGVKTDVSMSLPGELFRFLKRGMVQNPTVYNIKGIKAGVQAYLEAALGYARELDPQLTVGGKFKFLVGVAEASVNVNRMDITMGNDEWIVNTDADFNVYGRLVDVNFKKGALPDVGLGQYTPAGYGFAFDLGAEYRPDFAPGLRISAAVTDLGLISYTAGSTKRFHSTGSVDFTGIDPLDETLSFDQLGGDLAALFDFQADAAAKGAVRMVSPTLNIGAEYALWENRFSVGLLSSTVFYYGNIESELSIVGTVHPCRWFSASLAYSLIGGNRGLGWALNFTPKWGLNFFFASNYTPLRVNGTMMPLRRAHGDFQFGMTIPIGNNRRYTYKTEPSDINYGLYNYRKEGEGKPNRFTGEDPGVLGGAAGRMSEGGEDVPDEGNNPESAVQQ